MNQLSRQSSPYLLQHATNPVQWHPWGDDAFAKAKAEDKPIFLSIGYSACHWCHVMAHESFADDAIARIMNEHFVSIKVDREERPDVDAIYMNAVMAMTGHGGWPLSVFLTPDRKPFYGGTYFPAMPRYGMPSFAQVLSRVAQAFREQREDLAANANALLERIQATLPRYPQTGLDPSLPEEAIEEAIEVMRRDFDAAHGGTTGSPKFPQPMAYDFLLRAYHRNGNPVALEMVELTLRQMACGGIYDQLAGGFHRYSVDAVWLVPHFEKMLYDNALLARLYLHTYQVTGNALYRRIVVETLDYVTREMTDPAGGFYSAQAADSDGEEGKFFVWTPAEIVSVLGAEEGNLFCAAYGVTPQGNFAGRSILHRSTAIERLAGLRKMSLDQLQAVLQRAKVALLEEREQRTQPCRDEKIITAWNGLMLAAFAEAGRVLQRPDYIDMAVRNAEFVLSTMIQKGRLLRTWRGGSGAAKLMAYLEDYAFYADGLLALYQTTFDPRWFQAARTLMEVVLQYFIDENEGGFFDTADDHEKLVIRPRNLQDNAIPCGNSMAVRTLLLLAAYTGERRYEAPAIRALAAMQGTMRQYPMAFAHWLGALTFVTAPPKEVGLIGRLTEQVTTDMLRLLQQHYRPNQVVALSDGTSSAEQPALVQDRRSVAGKTTAYVCQNLTCQRPATSVAELKVLLQS